jgi:uncharacterized protein (DUF2147 family)
MELIDKIEKTEEGLELIISAAYLFEENHYLEAIRQKKDKWEGGKIYNPKNGKTYKCAIWIEDGKLKVRGYLGVFYETQTWNRK